MSPAIFKVKVSTFLLIAVPIGVLIIIVLAITLPQINRSSLDAESGIYDENDVDEEDEEEGQYTPDCPTSELCTDELCQRASKYFLSSIDFAITPCHDFYNFTCGKLKTSPIDNVREQIRTLSKTILTAGNSNGDPPPVQMARNFYQSCSGNTRASHFGDIALILEKLKLPTLPSLLVKNNFNFDWRQSLALIEKYLDVDILFSFRVGPDYNQGKFVMIFEAQSQYLSSLTKFGKYLSNRNDNNYYLREEIVKSMIKQEKVTVPTGKFDDVLRNLGKTMDKLDKLTGRYTDPSSIILKCYTIPGFQKLTSFGSDKIIHPKDKHFWQKYVETVFEDTDVTIDYDKDEICATAISKKFLSKIFSWLGDIPTNDLELLMWYKVVLELAHYTGQYFRDIKNPRSYYCVDLVNEYWHMAVAYKMPLQDYSVVDMMWKEIDQAFIRRVRRAKWMDEATKDFIEDKVKNRITVIGYPDWFRNEDKLTQFYEGYGIKIEEILRNVVNMTAAENIRDLKKLRTTAERVMTKSPLTVDVKYEQDSNVLMINMGMLQFPLHYFGQKKISYGLLGSVVAGGILRGFDSIGMHYGKFGQPVEDASWWDSHTAKRFHLKKGCFTDQYNSYSVYGVNITVRVFLREATRECEIVS
ncbi:neprilysin-1-like isoform X2 [Tenebrio molitor]|uniref:neprilysin-1-like isoform X2 n=1 Tax=Tenebrio molitor TaxID=7067 RepID=UPI0036247DDE